MSSCCQIQVPFIGKNYVIMETGDVTTDRPLSFFFFSVNVETEN